MMKQLVAASLLAVGSAACVADDGPPVDPNAPHQLYGQTENPNLTLFVSNQSLDKTNIDIQVYVDGNLAIAGNFNVFQQSGGEGCGFAPAQHNWHRFELGLPDGEHVIRVVSNDVSVTLDSSVMLDAHKYGVLNYWFDATSTETPEEFALNVYGEEPAFD